MSGMLEEILEELSTLEASELYERDFTALERKSDQELAAVFAVADALGELWEKNYTTALFTSGLALWEGPAGADFAAFARAAAMLGLRPVAVDELSEAALVRAGADVICPRTDLSQLRDRLYRERALSQRPLILPRTTGLALVLDALHQCGGVRELQGCQVPLHPQDPGDLPALLERFGALTADRKMEDDERFRLQRLEGYVLAAMILLGKFAQPVRALEYIRDRAQPRRFA